RGRWCEEAAGIEGDIGVVAVGDAGQGRQLSANLKAGARDDHLVTPGPGDGLVHPAVMPGVDQRAVDDLRAREIARPGPMPTADDAMPARLNQMPAWLISQAALHGHRLLAHALAAMDANGYQYRLLAALEEFGPACQAALGRRTGIDRSDVVAALN